MGIFNIKVEDVIHEEDGSCRIIFDIPEEFKLEYLKCYELSEWDDEHFNKFVVDSLTAMAERVETERNLKNPDFLWSVNENS